MCAAHGGAECLQFVFELGVDVGNPNAKNGVRRAFGCPDCADEVCCIVWRDSTTPSDAV